MKRSFRQEDLQRSSAPSDMPELIDDAPHLDRAPIVEAIVDFRVKPRDGFDAKNLEPLRKAISPRYGNFQQKRMIKAEVGFRLEQGVIAAAPPNAATDTLMGFRCESLDKHYVLQANVDGFTVSRLGPYDRWEALRDEARQLWDRYVEEVKPTSVVRTAVRYINRLELPSPVDFDEYLTCGPKIPADLPQACAGFVGRVVVPFGDDGIQIVITQALQPFDQESMKVPVLLDVDVFLERVFDVSDGAYWQTLEDLRVLKNRGFFGSITRKTVELYK